MNLLPSQQKVSVEPDIYTWDAEENDMLILCCDGVFDVMSNEVLAQTVTELVTQTNGDIGVVASLVQEPLGVMIPSIDFFEKYLSFFF